MNLPRPLSILILVSISLHAGCDIPKRPPLTERLERESREQDEADKRVSQNRPATQIKPGNLVYLKVQDADRDLNGESLVYVQIDNGRWLVDHVQRQARDDKRIFAVSREALTDAVTAGARALGIPDLRLHDMRREATSRLRELGFDADARKAVTGHRSDEIHSRYVSVTLDELHQQYAAGQGTEPRPPRPRKVPGRQA